MIYLNAFRKTLYCLALCIFSAPAAGAATLSSTLIFNPALEIVDGSSGNHRDFSFNHILSPESGSVPEILSGLLTIRHSDNSNEGPTREIWSVFAGADYYLGDLSQSTENAVTDTFSLPSVILEEIFAQDSRELQIGLSERTSFNREKILLLESVLQIETADEKKTRIPETPEPASFILVILGLSALFYRRLPKIRSSMMNRLMKSR